MGNKSQFIEIPIGIAMENQQFWEGSTPSLVPSSKLTVRPWQIGAGRWVSTKDGLFSGSVLTFQRVNHDEIPNHRSTVMKNHPLEIPWAHQLWMDHHRNSHRNHHRIHNVEIFLEKITWTSSHAKITQTPSNSSWTSLHRDDGCVGVRHRRHVADLCMLLAVRKKRWFHHQIDHSMERSVELCSSQT